MLKNIARSSIAHGARTIGVLRAAERRNTGQVVILCYHRVLPASLKQRYPFPDLVVTPKSFRQQLRTVTRHYEIRTLREAVPALHNNHAGDRPIAVITFDDGYRDNIEMAAPILGEIGIKATLFVIAGLVGTDECPWYDRLANGVCRANGDASLAKLLHETLGCDAWHKGPDSRQVVARQTVALAKHLTPEARSRLLLRIHELSADRSPGDEFARIMTREDLRQLSQAGHEIGAHSMTHEILTLLPDDKLREEVVESKSALETMIDQTVSSFCYPNGNVDDRVAAVVRQAGYRASVSTKPGANSATTDLFRLHRSFIHEGRLRGVRGDPSGTLLRMQLAGI